MQTPRTTLLTALLALVLPIIEAAAVPEPVPQAIWNEGGWSVRTLHLLRHPISFLLIMSAQQTCNPVRTDWGVCDVHDKNNKYLTSYECAQVSYTFEQLQINEPLGS